MTRPWIKILCLSLTSLPIGFGCNAVLGNEHGDLIVDEAGTITPDASADDARDTAPAADIDAAQDADDAKPSSDCASGKKLCFGQCVSNTDPLYGCDSAACTPCAMARASATCAGGACAIAACDPGYSDCNKLAADGCETDLAQASHCGTCNSVCDGTPTPYCSPSGGGGFACSTNCSALAPTLCGTECADLNTSRTHCGNCTNECPLVANGQETCVARACELTCATNFHVCGNACASNADPSTCGSSCSPCIAPANATSTCNAGSCGFVCKPGFHNCSGACVSNSAVTSCGTSSCGTCPSQSATSSCNGISCGFTCTMHYADCDMNPANACEASLWTDPLNCGTCGHSCMGQACNIGVCDVVDAGMDAGPG